MLQEATLLAILTTVATTPPHSYPQSEGKLKHADKRCWKWLEPGVKTQATLAAICQVERKAKLSGDGRRHQSKAIRDFLKTEEGIEKRQKRAIRARIHQFRRRCKYSLGTTDLKNCFGAWHSMQQKSNQATLVWREYIVNPPKCPANIAELMAQIKWDSYENFRKSKKACEEAVDHATAAERDRVKAMCSPVREATTREATSCFGTPLLCISWEKLELPRKPTGGIGRRAISTYHPGAEFSIRGVINKPGGRVLKDALWPSIQCTYDEQGDYIKSQEGNFTAAAGSVDLRRTGIGRWMYHRPADVAPFDVAWFLDCRTPHTNGNCPTKHRQEYAAVRPTSESASLSP